MVALQIRDVPDDIRQTLAEQAAARGQSLQAFLLMLVTDEARRSANVAVLERFGARKDGSQLSTAQATEALDQARAEREPLLSNADSDAR
jgi:plasmid stability protein